MFELLKVFVGKVLGKISVIKIMEYHKNAKVSNVGADLFMLYMSLNKIYVNGVEIVEELNKAIVWMERKCKEKKGDQEYGTYLPQLLRNQKIELTRFMASFERLNAELSILDRDSYEIIRAFVYPKAGMLDYLLQSIDEPTDVDLFFVDEKGMDKITEVIENQRGRHQLDWIGNLPSASINNMGSIPANKAPILKAYLKERAPMKHLSDIKKHLNKLHAILLKNFTSKDIILKVGDERLNDKRSRDRRL
jgi:hypothetical protein